MVLSPRGHRHVRQPPGDALALFLVYGLLVSAAPCQQPSPDDISSDDTRSFNVLEFGAVGDGVSDDTQAFLGAWEEICNLPGYGMLVLPESNVFLVKPVVFRGPCVARSITIEVLGVVVAPKSPAAWEGKDAGKWLRFDRVTDLRITGSGLGVIDGRGFAWWSQSCRYHPDLEGCTKVAPTAMTFSSCRSSSLTDLMFVNSSQTHFLVMNSQAVVINNAVITAPARSPNTDGIHVHSSRHVVISNSLIATGDDCVSIGDRTFAIQVSNVICGPGHGISIGSLGRGGNYAEVENIHVSRSYLKGTTNGVRIKTWQVGRGYVRRVIFEDTVFEDVKNPIIIDQNYCDKRGACKERPTGVHIYNVTYRNMLGTSSTRIAINLNCSKSYPCLGLMLEAIHLWPSGTRSAAETGLQVVTASCNNARGIARRVNPPPLCLQP